MEIEFAESRSDLWKEIYDSEDLHHCFNCSTCIAGCPASHGDPPLLVRNLARMVILGLEEELLDEDSPWACVSCSRCEEMCPMDVKPFELILAIRKWQSYNDVSYFPTSVVEIYKRGYTQAVGAIICLSLQPKTSAALFRQVTAHIPQAWHAAGSMSMQFSLRLKERAL